MPLKDLLKKRDKITDDAGKGEPSDPAHSPSEFTFMRTDTNTQELIQPPSFPGEDALPTSNKERHTSKLVSRFRSSSNASISSKTSNQGEKRLSQRLHLRSASRASSTSSNIPEDLPAIEGNLDGSEEREAKWEERATILAKESPITNHPTAAARDQTVLGSRGNSEGRPPLARNLSDAKGDETIQEAIRLHEAGNLEESTAMFGRLAESNAMAQILYGLALRHGWGTKANPSLAITYLSQAASSSAAVESQALQSGMKKGGAAKGELVLAMYELANSFRHGWGVEKDPVAARSYYETAANLGDTDAMNEVARCYEEGFGGKKDKVRLRLMIEIRWIGSSDREDGRIELRVM
ncbi:MAG: hypothetical protein Q9191_000459 [Dirinaria sp. TL-2023a]